MPSEATTNDSTEATLPHAPSAPRRDTHPALSRFGRDHRAASACYVGTRVNEDLDWLPDEGVALTRRDLERIMIDLRALIDGTDALDANRAHAVDIVITITQALERGSGGT